MLKRVINCRKWANSAKGKTYTYDESYNNPLELSKCCYKDGVMSCVYQLSSAEELCPNLIRKHIVSQMRPWRKCRKYICVVNPKAYRTTYKYEIQYYQRIDDDYDGFPEAFEKACISAADECF